MLGTGPPGYSGWRVKADSQRGGWVGGSHSCLLRQPWSASALNVVESTEGMELSSKENSRKWLVRGHLEAKRASFGFPSHMATPWLRAQFEELAMEMIHPTGWGHATGVPLTLHSSPLLSLRSSPQAVIPQPVRNWQDL